MSRTSRTAIPFSLAALIGLALAIGLLLQPHSPGAVSAAQDASVANDPLVITQTFRIFMPSAAVNYSTLPCVPPPTEMALWLPLDETSGATATDIAGFPTNGTLFNGPAHVPGAVAGALSFDGVDDYVEVAHDPSLDVGEGDLTLDAWIQTNDTTHSVKTLVDQRINPANPIGYKGYSLFLNLGGTLGFELAHGNGSLICAPTGTSCTNYDSNVVVTDGGWHHIAVTVKRDSPTGGQFYVDGEPVPLPHGVFNPMSQQGSLTNNGPLRLGSRSFSVTGLYHGILDEVELFPRVLTPAEIKGIFRAGSNGKCKACVPPPAEMALWLPLDETSGTTATDIAGYPTNGTHVNGPVPVPGAVAGGLSFDGVDDYVEVAHDPSLDVGEGDLTLDAWIQTNDTTHSVKTLVDQRINPANPIGYKGYSLFLNLGGTLGFELAHGNGSLICAPTGTSCTNYDSNVVVTDGGWHHIAVTVKRDSPTGGQFYVDGEPVPLPHGVFNPMSQQGSLTNDGPLRLGSRSFSVTGLYHGILDEVELFPRVLTPAEIKGIFRAGSNGKCKACVPPPAEMALWLPLDETSGTTATDIAGFPTNGTHVNGPVPVPGAVAGGLSFDGVDDYVEVAHDPSLDVGEGDLTLDAWIQTNDTTHSVKTLVDQRINPANPIGYKGYSLFLNLGGTLGFELAHGNGSLICAPTGTSCTNYDSNVVVTDGGWHHIAVTVKRDSPTGGQFYVDGEPVPLPHGVFNPMSQQGSLTNNGPLRLGSRSFSVTGLYHGILDEVELFPRVLTPAEIKGIFRAGSNGKCKACVPPPAEMALWLPLDETSGTTATDIAGYPTNGTHVNGPVPVPGAVAGGLSFDGVDDYVEVAHDPSLDVGEGDLTLDAWIQTNDTTHSVKTLVDQRINPANPIGYKGYSLFLNLGGTLGFELAHGNGSLICAPTGTSCTNYDSNVVVTDGGWHHIAVTVKRDSPTGGQFYVDGEPVPLPHGVFNPMSQQGSLTNDGPLRLGSRSFSVTGLYHGILDEVELFPRVLTPAEIKGIFRAGSNGKCKACVPPPAEMALWLPLDETSGTTATDIAGFPTNGTHVNGPVPVPGAVAGGLSFDGVDDYVEVAHDPSLDVGEGDLTLDAWIQTNDTTHSVKTLVDQRINPANPIGYKGYSLFLNLGGTLGFELAHGNGSLICAPTGTSCTNYDSNVVVTDGGWHHIAVTVKRDSPTGGQFYVDGEPVPLPHGVFNPMSQQGSLTNNGPLRLGSRSFSVTGLYHGILDEVELFPRVLTPAEIKGIFRAGSNGKCKCVPPPAEMAAWFPLDETSGATAFDIAGYPTNGTYSSVPNSPSPWPGKVAGARYFGQNYVEVADDPSLNFDKIFSMDAWLWTVDRYGMKRLVDKRAVATNGVVTGYSLFLYDGILGFHLTNASGSGTYYSTKFVADGMANGANLYHVAVTLDRYGSPPVGKFYVNGVHIAAGDFSPLPGLLTNPSPLRMGCNSSSFTEYYRGALDEVELFPRVLTPAEIQGIFQAGSSGKCKTTTCATTEMVPVPADKFRMGCDSANNGGYACQPGELPFHSVSLDAYRIDKTEVTNCQYAQCVTAGACTTPANNSSSTHSSYYNNTTYADYPVTWVNWPQADAYCHWAGQRLPTEAQWERAARGISLPTYAYPWGNAAPICAWANFYDSGTGTYCVGDTRAAGSYAPAGASPYGALDMAGNVFEWVNDWYDSSFYSSPSAGTNPIGAVSGNEKVARGGSWGHDQGVARAAFRGKFAPDFAFYWLGFRCVSSP